jgi:hypothetical protein
VLFKYRKRADGNIGWRFNLQLLHYSRRGFPRA